MDADKDIDNEEEILNLFLGVTDSKVISFIEVIAWTEKMITLSKLEFWIRAIRIRGLLVNLDPPLLFKSHLQILALWLERD